MSANKNVKGYNKFIKIKKAFPQTLSECHGIIRATCLKLNISFDWYYKERKRDPAFAKKCDDVEIVKIGIAEDVLMKAIINESPWAIQFFLARRCREKYGVTIKEEEPQKHEINVNFKPKDADIDAISRYDAEIIAKSMIKETNSNNE